MLDRDGYRLNVGIVIASGSGEVLWAHRVRRWLAVPQGGMQDRETPEQAMYRELHEEVGLKPDQVDILGVTRGWLRYRLPEKMIRPAVNGQRCIGQKQKWFLLHLDADETAVDINATHNPEFSEWQWVSYWYPLTQIIEFKRWVYKRMLKELSAAHSDKVRQLGRRGAQSQYPTDKN